MPDANKLNEFDRATLLPDRSTVMGASTTATMSEKVSMGQGQPDRIEWVRPRRWKIGEPWRLAGFDGTTGFKRFKQWTGPATRPSLVSNTTPQTRAEILVPARSTLGGFGLIGAALLVIIFYAGAAAVTARYVRSLPVALVVFIVAVGVMVVVSIDLAERARLTFKLPTDHVRLQDVESEWRGSGMGEAGLGVLLAGVYRPMILNVDRESVKVIAMYGRLGFTVVDDDGSSKDLTMTRPGRPVEEWPNDSGVVGLTRWFWPSSRDVVFGVAAGAACWALATWGAWSTSVVAATIGFVVVTGGSADWRTHRIPNVVSVGGVVFVAFIAAIVGEIPDAAAGAALMAGPLLAMNIATRGRTPGLGDVKLAAAAGGALGMLSLPAVFAALLVALLGGGVFGIVHQHRHGPQGFPFGPAIAAGSLVALIGLAIEGFA